MQSEENLEFNIFYFYMTKIATATQSSSVII